MRRGSLTVVAAVLLALLAQSASANPFVPTSCPPDPKPVVVSYDPITPLGDHLADFSWTISIRYCGGDPVNRSDPMGTSWLISGEVAEGGSIAFTDPRWVNDGTGFKDRNPTPGEIAATQAMMTARLQGQPAGTYWEDVSIQQSVGVTVVGDALGSQRIWMGDSWLQVQTPMAFRRSGGKWMRQGTPGATVVGGGFDFGGETEAGLEHYILIQLEAYARVKAGTGTKAGTVGLLADAYGAADEMVLAGLAQWMIETDAGHAAAQDAGLIGAAGGVLYALAKKFHAERLVPSKVKTLIEGAKAKIRALIREFSISDAPPPRTLRPNTGPRASGYGCYGDLSGSLPSGHQANHLNQNAVYGSIIPKNEGVSVGLIGDATSGFGTQHFEFHTALESFWNKYRRGGPLFGHTPTNAEYANALNRGLLAAGKSADEAAELCRIARQQRLVFGLDDADFVPRIPNPIGTAHR